MTLESLGVSFGDHAAFYEANEWNARGYFERRDVMDLNSLMLTSFARTQSPIGTLFGQLRYLLEPSVRRVVARGSELVDEMEAVATEIGSGAIKDPRFCITWPAWSAVAAIDGCVVCIRHPYEVADSLLRRQRIPLALGIRFWRYHMRALRLDPPPNMVVVDMASLRHRPMEELRMLIGALGLGYDPAEAVSLFRGRYEPNLAKTSSANNMPRLGAETRDLWEWLVSQRPIPIVESPR